MTTDLGVECMVGLCLAAAIWWIARRRRTHTEGPKTRLDPLGLAELEPLSTTDDKTKDDLLVEDNSMQGNASGVSGKDLLLDSSPSPLPQQQEEEQSLADDVDNEPDQEGEEDKDESWDVEDEDDAAEPDLTDDEDEEGEAGDDEEEEHEEEEDEDDEDEEEKDEPRVVSAEIEEIPLETLAKVEALAAKMGVNMTESFMAMEEFLVLDAPPSPGHDVLHSVEADRMRLEDPAVVVPLSDTASENPSGEETDDNTNDDDEQPVAETKEDEEEDEEVRERRESHDDNEQQQEDALVPDQAEAASFWAKCENKEECNLCHTPFTFLTRRHHCRKCFASVCGACSANSAPLPEFGARVERVCDTCWASLQQQKQDEHKAS